MKTLISDASGESLVWWNWQNLAGTTGKNGHARARLHFLDNCAEVEWVFGPKRLSFCFECANKAVGDDNLSFSISVIGVIALYFNLATLRIVERLPGVDFKSGNYYDGQREISIAYVPGENNWIHWRLWRNPTIGKSRDWRDGGLHLDDLIFGRSKYSDREIGTSPCVIAMPEGDYNAMARRFVSTWTRKRWSKPVSVNRVEIDIPGGISIPRKGENSWDQYDDATLSFTTNADTVDEAIANLRQSILTRRKKYGGEDWLPADND